jgi:uncharacterized protein
MPALHLTLLFAGLCALFQCMLTGLVVVRRVQTKVTLMDGGDATLLRRIRAHGNFAETVPLALLLIALLELRGAPASWLWGLGGALLAGRVLHATGLLTQGPMWMRLAGMVLTVSAISIGGLLCLVLFLR